MANPDPSSHPHHHSSSTAAVMEELSVEASNALRARLGLAPLRLTITTTNANQLDKEEQDPNQRTTCTQRLQQSNQQQEQKPPTARDALETQQMLLFAAAHPLTAIRKEDDSLKAWAQQMRPRKPPPANVEDLAPLTIPPPPPPPPPPLEYTSDDVQGLTVAHASSDFAPGSTVTLVLQDQGVLDHDHEEEEEEDDHFEDRNHEKANNSSNENHSRNGKEKKKKKRLHHGVVLESIVDLGRGDDDHRQQRPLSGERRANHPRDCYYAGVDDEEFEELGGSKANANNSNNNNSETPFRKGFFTIGNDDQEEEHKDKKESDLFVSLRGKAISLETSNASSAHALDLDWTASSSSSPSLMADFMTVHEDDEAAAVAARTTPQKYRNNRNKKKNTTLVQFKKKTKNKIKIKKKPNHDKKKLHDDENDDYDDNDSDGEANSKSVHTAMMTSTKSLLNDLEDSAESSLRNGSADQVGDGTGRRKRRRDSGGDEMDRIEIVGNAGSSPSPMIMTMTMIPPISKSPSRLSQQRAKFDAIMAKRNNKSTRMTFVGRDTLQPQPINKPWVARNSVSDSDGSKIVVAVEHDEEPDDAFLHAALTKARRLHRLKELSTKTTATTTIPDPTTSSSSSSEAKPKLSSASSMTTAKVIADAVKSSSFQFQPPSVLNDNDNKKSSSIIHSNSDSNSNHNGGSGTIDFTVDETREFTRALQARIEMQHAATAAKRRKKAVVTTTTTKAITTTTGSTIAPIASNVAETLHNNKQDATKLRVVENEHVGTEDADMNELANEIIPPDKEESATATATATNLEGATGATARLGRGLSGVLGLLQQTGELTHKNAGKEDLRGRAKDERHYEDYEALDLSTVVQLDDRTATSKDKELASRQIKLEYRDKHGRLLTRKEAFRDLSYQFHGYGSGKRKEEKKLMQIAREQAEARQSQTVGSLGALQQAQKATGKAYIVHKI